MPDTSTPLGLFDLADIPLRKATLELPALCQTTRDAKRVALGIWVFGYCCPLCSTEDDDYSAGDFDYSLSGFYACCFSWCSVGDHAVADSEHNVCDSCAGCDTDCCECLHCEQCGFVCDSYCDHCENGECCCSCDQCSYCERAVDSVCSNCDRCESHCECYWCGSCGCATEDYCGGCERCDECCYCSKCDSECEAPNLRFLFPANGKGTIREDERIEVTLPAGTIDDEGMARIELAVQDAIGRDHCAYWEIPKLVAEVGPLWQAKRGNFTRRLSSALHKHEVKLGPGVLSQVGNLAREHSSSSAVWYIEVTRDLNQSAAAFYHRGSCWFGGDSYGQSRCCLKAWGGLGIRSFASMEDDADVMGRAWVQPLTETLTPTHETVAAHAYAVYNGYGDLDGYIATRIVAYLTSRSYKKVSIHAGNQYINGEDSGYLVSDEATCASTERISYEYDNHDNLDSHITLDPPRQTRMGI